MYNPPEIARNDKTPTVLIAGGAGYLGTALCESLLSRNLRVVVIDNLETGQQKNIEPYLSHPRFAFFEYDLNKGLPEKIKSADMIFHLAAHETYLDTPDEKVALDGLLTNALATHHLLEFAKDCQARFIFASTVDIYQGIVSGTDLKHYFGPTENDEKIFSHTEAKRFAESLVWEYFKKYNLDVRLVRLGNLYGPGMNLSTAGPLGKFLSELLAGHNLFVEGDGLEKDYYCYLNDAVSGLVAVAFNDKAKGNIYPVTDPQPATVLELAYILKKYARPVTEVVFKPSSRKYHLPDVRVIDTQKLKELPWLPQTDLKQGVFLTLKALGYLPAENTASSPEITPPPTPKKTVPERVIKRSLLNFSLQRPSESDKPRVGSPKAKLSWLTVSAFLALTLLLVTLKPLITLAFYGLSANQQLNQLEQKARLLDLEGGVLAASQAVSSLESAKRSLDEIPSLPYKEGLDSLIITLLQTTKGVRTLLPALAPFRDELKQLGFSQVGSTPNATAVSFESVLPLVTEAGESFSLALAETKNLALKSLPPSLSQKAKILPDKVQTLTELTGLLKIFSLDALDLLGYRGKKTYLTLFENSQELRPGGGFIGSYARFSLDNGQLTDLKIDDIYNPDGLLDEKKIIMAPPLPLKENVGVVNLRIRDANWAADQTENGKIIADLYQKATGEKVNGIITLDLFTAARLLDVVGSVSLPTFNETITAGNLFERTEFHSEAAFFPGSAAKKTFLSLLSEQLLAQLLNLKPASFPQLASAIGNSLDSKDLLFYLPESRLATTLSLLGWDGSVRQKSGDFLMIVEANVGSTKANYFIRRQAKYTIEKISREGEMEASLALNYLHTGKDNTWPGGPYKDYLRILVPKRSALLKVERSDGSLEGKGTDITEQVKIGQESGKTTFETLFTVMAGESLAITFHYVIPPEILNIAASKGYNLYLQKQPGAMETPLTVDFTPPFGKTVARLPGLDGYSRLGQTIRWQGSFNRDLEISYPFN